MEAGVIFWILALSVQLSRWSFPGLSPVLRMDPHGPVFELDDELTHLRCDGARVPGAVLCIQHFGNIRVNLSCM